VPPIPYYVLFLFEVVGLYFRFFIYLPQACSECVVRRKEARRSFWEKPFHFISAYGIIVGKEGCFVE